MANTYLYGYGSGPYGSSGVRKTKAQLLSMAQFANVDPELMRRLFALADAVIAAGSDYGFGGGWRSSVQQYNLFKSRYVKIAPYSAPKPAGAEVRWNGLPNWPSEAGWYNHVSGASAAPPGTSYHESTTKAGRALAVDMLGNHAIANRIDTLYGLKDFTNVNNEPWHYQVVEHPNGKSAYTGNPDPLPTWPLPGTTPTPEPDMSELVAHNPIRLLDTRLTGKPGDGAVLTVNPADHILPPNASAVAVNLSVFDAVGGGYLTLWNGSGDPPADASQINYVPNSIENSFTLVPLAFGGFKVYTLRSVNILIDQVGYFTGQAIGP